MFIALANWKVQGMKDCKVAVEFSNWRGKVRDMDNSAIKIMEGTTLFHLHPTFQTAMLAISGE